MPTLGTLRVKTEIDSKTGEIIQQNSTATYKLEREPEYVKLYIDGLVKLQGLSASTMTVLCEILKHVQLFPVNPEGLIIILNRAVKRDILKATKLKKIQTIDNSILKLKKNGVLHRLDRGKYLVDPSLFGVGAWANIKRLRMVVDYNSLSDTINTGELPIAVE